ncbi:hypothetical protein [Fodinicola feengrottensis]
MLDISGTCHHRLVVYRATPGSSDHAALLRLTETAPTIV